MARRKKRNKNGSGLNQAIEAAAITDDECRLFIGYHDKRKNPIMKFQGKYHTVPRAVLILKLGREIAEGLQAVRMCRTAGCIAGPHIAEKTHAFAIQHAQKQTVFGRRRIFTDEQVRDIRERLTNGEMAKNIAIFHNVSHATISRIKHGTLYKDVL